MENIKRITEGVFAWLAPVRNTDGESKVVGLGRCLDNSKLEGFIPVTD